jgi:Ca-activated chloride channel homolog
MKLKSGILLLLIILINSALFSQTRTISGIVSNKTDYSPITGATVSIKNESVGTITDLDGRYELKIPNDTNLVLIVSFVGMKTTEVKVGTEKVLNISLEIENQQINEVVVTAMGVKKISQTTGSISSVSGSKSSRKALKGKVAGVSIANSNKGFRPIPNENKGFKPIITTSQQNVNPVNQNEIKKEEKGTEAYGKIVENDFKEVLTEPVSTFSIDVDKASYTNVRRYLTGNQLPPKDAVRIEEMLNYFDYEYPQPTSEQPFSLNMEMGKCPWNQDHYLVQIGIQGRTLKNNEVPASNLVFLLDVSGSMADPNKLPLVKSSIKILLKKLSPKDKVAIVVYAGAAGLALASTNCTEDNKPLILNAIDKLDAGGSTAGGEGIKLAYKVAKENFAKNGNNRIILATDGDFNVGASSNEDMEKLIEDERKSGVFLTVLGFGMGNYKDDKMETLADKGNGNYAYIDNILESKKVFGKDLQGTLFTIAKDVKIQIEFNPGKVKSYRLIGYENRLLNREDFNNDLKDAGEIGAGHTVTALYEIIPADNKETIANPNVDPLEYQTSTLVKSENLMTLKLRYKKPDENKSQLIEQRIKASDIRTNELSQNFRFSSAVAMFGMLLTESKYKGNADYTQVLEMAKKAKGEDEYGFRAEFIRMVEIAETLRN